MKYKISSNPLNSYYVSDEVIKQQDENFKFYKFQIDKNQEYLIDFKYTDEISNLNADVVHLKNNVKTGFSGHEKLLGDIIELEKQNIRFENRIQNLENGHK